MATTDKCQGIFPPEGSGNHFNHTMLEVILELSVPYNSHNFNVVVGFRAPMFDNLITYFSKSSELTTQLIVNGFVLSTTLGIVLGGCMMRPHGIAKFSASLKKTFTTTVLS